ncbi:MAG: Crp/Fnr family transcriptional regulator [Burkholderiales bacterium]
MDAPRSPKENKLLASLPAADYKRLAAGLDLVPMKLGAVVYENGDIANYAYFPLDCIVSLLSVMENGDSAEIAMVGREGIVGVSVFMGGASAPSRAVVQSAGDAYRIPADQMKVEFRRGGPIQYLLLRYTQALITQMAQTAACNRHHTIEQQLCRWLLLSLDRLPTGDLRMTQELIANMLGVRREGVTEAAGRLQADRIIQYSRGRIKVMDRLMLEGRACECYKTVKGELNRLLDGSYTD